MAQRESFMPEALAKGPDAFPNLPQINDTHVRWETGAKAPLNNFWPLSARGIEPLLELFWNGFAGRGGFQKATGKSPAAAWCGWLEGLGKPGRGLAHILPQVLLLPHPLFE